MKSYKYREVKFSLQNSENFTEEGLDRVKKMVISMLDKGMDPDSMQLIFCRDGFICPGSKADNQVLELRETTAGEGKFWVSKKKSGNKHAVTILLMGLFLLAFFSHIKI